MPLPHLTLATLFTECVADLVLRISKWVRLRKQLKNYERMKLLMKDRKSVV